MQKKPGTIPGFPPVMTPSPEYREPAGRTVAPAPETRRQEYDFDMEDEGHYEEPYAGVFGDEGSRYDPLAGSFSGEGSFKDPLAERYSSEGRMNDTLAAAFAGEGISSMDRMQTKAAAMDQTSGDGIADMEEYDYNISPDDEDSGIKINLRKAVIYSEILNRKEYVF